MSASLSALDRAVLDAAGVYKRAYADWRKAQHNPTSEAQERVDTLNRVTVAERQLLEVAQRVR